MSSRSLSDIQTRAEGKYQIKIGYVKHTFILNFLHELLMSILMLFKKLINNSRGKYKRNECLINVCKSDTDLS
jgi:hypothetical protein